MRGCGVRGILRGFSSVRLVSTTEGTLAFTESKSLVMSVSKAIVNASAVAETIMYAWSDRRRDTSSLPGGAGAITAS